MASQTGTAPARVPALRPPTSSWARPIVRMGLAVGTAFCLITRAALTLVC